MLVDLFECIRNFLECLHIYTDVPMTPSMTDIIVKIMVELLSVFALATKQVNQVSGSPSSIHDSLRLYRKICEEATRRE